VIINLEPKGLEFENLCSNPHSKNLQITFEMSKTKNEGSFKKEESHNTHLDPIKVNSWNFLKM
jgi:hypothetical protein